MKLLSSRAVSKLGDVLYDYGNSTWIASIGGLGQKILGIYQIVELLVSIVLNPFGGALADRFQRRKILLITDAICAIMCFLLSFIGDDKVMVYGLIVANAILAVSNAFSSPAYKSYIPEIVDKADIITYNANLETIVQIISVSSPVLGFLIFNNFGIRITLIVDAITFLISFLFLYAIKVERVQLSKQEKVAIKNILADIADGFTYIKKEKEIMFFLIIAALLNTFLAMFNYLLPFTNSLLKTSGAYATILSISAIGSIIGALIARKIKSSINSMLSMLVFSSLGVIVMGFPSLFELPIWISYSGSFLFNSLLTMFNIHFFSQVQIRVDEAYMGRVMSTIFTIAIMFMPIGTLFMTIFSFALSNVSFIVIGCAIAILGGLGFSYSKKQF
ncbi:TPA: MFS transporter [Streptococcus agalactiae]|nr:MFS transporter [Streptococcus agalactiae]